MTTTETVTNLDLATMLWEYVDRRVSWPVHQEITRAFDLSHNLAYALVRELITDLTPEGREWLLEMAHSLNAGWESGRVGADRVVVPPANPPLPVPAA